MCSYIHPCSHSVLSGVHAQADTVTAAKLRAAAGLAALDGRRYKAAARALVDVSPELGAGYSDVSAAAAAAASGSCCCKVTIFLCAK